MLASAALMPAANLEVFRHVRDTAAVLMVIDDGSVSVDVSDEHSRTLLHYACSTGNAALVNQLLDRGAPIDARAHRHLTPLHNAAAQGQTACATVLLRHSAATAVLEARTDKRLTPMHLAAAGGFVETIALLARSGADIHARDDGRHTPLHWAAAGGWIDAVALLLRCGAPIDATDSRGRTPLFEAAARGRLRVVQLLLSRGANAGVVTEAGATAVMIAHNYGHVEVMKAIASSTPAPPPPSSPSSSSSAPGNSPGGTFAKLSRSLSRGRMMQTDVNTTPPAELSTTTTTTTPPAVEMKERTVSPAVEEMQIDAPKKEVPDIIRIYFDPAISSSAASAAKVFKLDESYTFAKIARAAAKKLSMPADLADNLVVTYVNNGSETRMAAEDRPFEIVQSWPADVRKTGGNDNCHFRFGVND